MSRRRPGASRERPDSGSRLWPGNLLASLLLVLLALVQAAPAHAQTFPPFTGFVVDAANVLPGTDEAALTAKLDAFQKATGRQLVVATVPDLQGYPIEDYGYQLGRAWAVGLKGMDNGALLIVAPAERKVRVEVGYGLEGVLTDAFSSVVINSRIVPAFKAGNIPGGITAGTDALIEQLSLPDPEAKAKLAAAVAEYDRTHQAAAHHGGVPFGLIFWGIVLLFVLLSHARGRGGRGRRYGGSNWPIVLWGLSNALGSSSRGGSGFGGWGGGSSDGGGGWGGGGFGGGGGGSFGGGGASGSW